MKIIVIESKDLISSHLQSAGFTVKSFRHSAVPSLTALLLEHMDTSGLVIEDGSTMIWSAAHLLSAAQLLEAKGHTILFSEGALAAQCRNAKLVSIARTKEEIPDLLRKPVRKSAGGRFLPKKEIAPMHNAPAPESPTKIDSMNIPADKILFIGVVGSQQRIGCTTQAIVLWHYCKALGFDPAIVTDAEQIARIGGTMRTTEISAGCLIEGIPFVTDAALSYDCYILDIGTGSVQEAAKVCDHIVLVAGSKPWELQYTAAAVRAAKGKRASVILSFTSQSDANSLQPLLGGQAGMVAPWLPEIWKPALAALAVYDALLRPVLERILFPEKPQPENEPLQAKGD